MPSMRETTPPCSHLGQVMRRTDRVLVQGEWKASTLIEVCATCEELLKIRTYPAAFMSEGASRMQGEWEAV